MRVSKANRGLLCDWHCAAWLPRGCWYFGRGVAVLPGCLDKELSCGAVFRLHTVSQSKNLYSSLWCTSTFPGSQDKPSQKSQPWQGNQFSGSPSLEMCSLSAKTWEKCIHNPLLLFIGAKLALLCWNLNKGMCTSLMNFFHLYFYP